MALWSINQLNVINRGLRNEYSTYHGNLLFGEEYNPPSSGTDRRPEWVKPYVKINTDNGYVLDDYIGDKYQDYKTDIDTDDPKQAFRIFSYRCYMYGLTHTNELNMVYKAFASEYDPIENYDRKEDSTVANSSTSGATSKVSPDDSEIFYNTGNAESSASGTTTTTSRIHGNIGVTRSDELVKAVSNFYINNAYIDYMLEHIIGDLCFICE